MGSADFHGMAPAANLTGGIAVVEPIFSNTAYASAFYVFYTRYGGSNEPVTSDLNLLNVTVKDGWGWSYGLRAFLSSSKAKQQGLFIGDNVKVIDEINVTLGGLFRGGKRAYDVVILGFTEYVTIEEYYAYKEFVATGGTLIIMDACNFLAQVKYYPPTSPDEPGYLSLVKGHGWEFNGTHAWKSVYHRWWDENINWIGGNYWHYWGGNHYDCLIANTSHPISVNLRSSYGESISTSYGAHEENLLQNFTDSEIIGFWHLINPGEYPGQPITEYQHRYVNGSVFHTGIMASDKVNVEEPLQAFLVGAVRLALTGDVGDWCFPRDTALIASISFRDSSGNQIGENGTLSAVTYCTISLNTISINHQGATYGLTSVSIRIYQKNEETSYGYSRYPTQVAEANKTDASGLSWQITINTTSYRDDVYAFQPVCKFSALVNSGDQISQTLAATYREIHNSIDALKTAIVVVLVTFASVMALAYSFFLLDRRHRKH